MNRSYVVISVVVFLFILLMSLGIYMYHIFINTPYPDFAENLDSTSSAPLQSQPQSQSLTEKTLKIMSSCHEPSARGYCTPPSQSAHQGALPPLPLN